MKGGCDRLGLWDWGRIAPLGAPLQDGKLLALDLLVDPVNALAIAVDAQLLRLRNNAHLIQQLAQYLSAGHIGMNADIERCLYLGGESEGKFFELCQVGRITHPVVCPANPLL